MDVPVKISKWVEQYLAIRTKIKEIEERQKQELAPYEAMKLKLAGHMLAFLDATGQTSAKTDAGTVHVVHRPTASLADPDAFMEYVVEHGAFELMDRRANSTACREFEQAHGSLPPGVKINTIRTAGVRQS